MSWREVDGPSVMPRERTPATEVISEAPKNELGAEVKYKPAGLRWSHDYAR
jgi:hypothetical protein